VVEARGGILERGAEDGAEPWGVATATGAGAEPFGAASLEATSEPASGRPTRPLRIAPTTAPVFRSIIWPFLVLGSISPSYAVPVRVSRIDARTLPVD
jgi:hypothetical protein